MLYNYGRPQVSNYLIANALYWVEKYHVDGIRMDAGNANEVNLENSTITAYEPVVFRKASSAFKFNFVGLNTLNKGGDYHIVVASGVCPTLTGADGFDIKLP